MTAKSLPMAHRTGAQNSLGITPLETAKYTLDLLMSLHGMAVHQSQLRLAELLESAAAEASRLVVSETVRG